MLQWNVLHAYNAVHMVRIAGELDVVRLASIVPDFLQQRGLTHLHLDCQRHTYEYAGGREELAIPVVAAGTEAMATLVAEAERQLNVAFAQSERFSPFRFFVVPEAGSFLLGLVYLHAVADAESIVWLLKDLVNAYAGASTVMGTTPLERYPRHFDNLLRHYPQVLARRLLDLPSQVRNMRSSCRLRYQDAGNMNNGLRLFTLGREWLRSLIDRSKDWQVTVNDLLLALLMKALSPLAGGQPKAMRRNKLSLGCIVNTRKDLGVDSRRTFGLYLGSFMVTQAVPEGVGIQPLAMNVRNQTMAIKRHRLYLGTPWELGFGRLMLAFFSPHRRKLFYQKNYPLWGGMTNMNLKALWPSDEGAAMTDYYRAVSTGPVTPLVCSATTIGDHMNLALTYRTTVFSAAAVEQIQSRFQEGLMELGKCA